MRTRPEWIGADDNSKIPQRIKVRVADRANNRCQSCGMRVVSRGQIDHVIALANWRAKEEAPHGNRETNLQLLCQPCHLQKTYRDVSEKSKIYQTKRKLGPLKREHSPWSKLYRAQKEWKRNRDLERKAMESED